MIVVDTNVVAYLLIAGDRTAEAEAVRAKDDDWHVPLLFLHEWLNVLAAYVREELINRDTAVRLFRRGIAKVRVEAIPVDPSRVLNLHIKTGCSRYDCQFMDLAERLDATLVTLDKQVLASRFGESVDMVTFVRGDNA